MKLLTLLSPAMTVGKNDRKNRTVGRGSETETDTYSPGNFCRFSFSLVPGAQAGNSPVARRIKPWTGWGYRLTTSQLLWIPKVGA